jgi:nitrite reductase/ring-hydroxylating ferredoxin subunit
MTSVRPRAMLVGQLDVVAMTDNTIARAVTPGSATGVAVAKAEGRVYVFPDRCPHGRSRLSGGTLEGSVITCPMHGLRFDLPTGRPIGCRSPALRTTELSVVPSTSGRARSAGRAAGSGMWARFMDWIFGASRKFV